MRVAGFEWDEGNWPKCGVHGLSRSSIEFALTHDFATFDDPASSDEEHRYRAIGRDEIGRHVFIVFCLRVRGPTKLVRPISARYMHEKEVLHYEQQSKGSPAA